MKILRKCAESVYTKRILKVKKRFFAKTTWYDLLVDYILELIKNAMGGVASKIMSFLKTNKTKDESKLTPVNNFCNGRKTLTKLKIRKQSEDNMIKNVRNLFKLKNENEEIKNRVIGDIGNLFNEKKIIRN